MGIVLVLALGFWLFSFQSTVTIMLENKNKNSSIFMMHCFWPSKINLFSDNLLKDYRD